MNVFSAQLRGYQHVTYQYLSDKKFTGLPVN